MMFSCQNIKSAAGIEYGFEILNSQSVSVSGVLRSVNTNGEIQFKYQPVAINGAEIAGFLRMWIERDGDQLVREAAGFLAEKEMLCYSPARWPTLEQCFPQAVGDLAGRLSAAGYTLREGALPFRAPEEGLSPRQETLFRSLCALASGDTNLAVDAYLARFPGYDPSSQAYRDFVRENALALGVLLAQISRGKNMLGLLFWMDQLLNVDFRLATENEAMWYTYLKECALWGSFSQLRPVIEAMRNSDRTEMASQSLAFVFAIRGQYYLATALLTGREHDLDKYFLYLSDDPYSLYRCYAECARQICSCGMLRQAENGYIYDWCANRSYGYAVNGFLISCFVNERDIDKLVLNDMKSQLDADLTYDPAPVRFQACGGAVFNVKRL